MISKIQKHVIKADKAEKEINVTGNKSPVPQNISLIKASNVEDVFADVRGKVKCFGDVMEPETEKWLTCQANFN